MLRFRLLVLSLSAALPVAGWALCTCGFGDGQFTLRTIAVDGDMADWADVHADVDNNVCDGPSGGLTDRDTPVQSTGRDLTHFAYTWDADNVYLFTERVGSASNTQSFAYYADIDNDGMMETDEPVIGVTWQGSNRNIGVFVFDYVASAPGGDPMADAGGFGDGYTLPGSFANVPSSGNPTRSGTWGSTSGLQMEFWITWAELGLPAGSPFTFHVSSANASLGAASFTSQVDDNLSGCGGQVGSTVFPNLAFVPDLTLAGFEGQAVAGTHTLTNTGNANDAFNLDAMASGDFAPVVSFYADTDGSGTFSGADTLLTDTTGDGLPDTGPLAPGAAVTILIVYDVPGGAGPGQSAVVTTTAASHFEPLRTESVSDTINVVLAPDLVVTKQAATLSDPVNLASNPRAIPGGVVLYTVSVANQGPGPVDADTFEITDAVPANACLVVTDIDAAGSGPVRFEDGTPASGLGYNFVALGDGGDDLAFSDDGGLTFGYSPSAGPAGCDTAVSHIRITPSGTFAGDGGAGYPNANFSFRVQLN